jgi:hypothetical protein
MTNEKEEIPEENYAEEEEADEEVYSSKGRSKLVEDDEISPWEAAFMEGADMGGQQAKCRKCGKMLDRAHRVVEKAINNELHRFCSDTCLDKFENNS